MRYHDQRRGLKLRLVSAQDRVPASASGFLARSRTFLTLVVGLLVLLIAGVSCAGAGGDLGPTAPPVSVSSVTIAGGPSDGTVLVGQNTTLSGTPRDASGTGLSGRPLLWTSSN